jgi:5-formyltetrahydrofolate cyclo-ligase
MITFNSKEYLRSLLLGRRCRLPFEEIYRRSSLVQERFLKLPEFSSARSIALYSSFKNEVLTDEIFLRALNEGKEVSFPRVVRAVPHLAFFRVGGKQELSPGSYDILEPPSKGERREPDSFDCVVVPGIAFDMSGARLGYGKGYYDRFLSAVRCPIIALAFDLQVLGENIPVTEHDVKMDSVVTESRVMRFSRFSMKS